MVQKNQRKAEIALKIAIKTDPDYLKPYGLLAKIFLSRNQLDYAVYQFKKILAPDSTLAYPHIILGTIYELKKEFTAAELQYRKALKNNPDFAPAANKLAYHLAEHTDKYDEALKYARKAKELIPENPAVLDTLGLAFYQKKLYRKAIGEFLDSLARMSDNPIVHYHLGLAYFKNGDFKLAKKEISLAIELNLPFDDKEKANNFKKNSLRIRSLHSYPR